MVDIKFLGAMSSIIYINLGVVLFYLGFSLIKSGFLIMMYHHSFRSMGIFFIAGLVYIFTISRNIYLTVGFINRIYRLGFIVILVRLNFPLIIGFLREVFVFLDVLL